MSSTPCVPEEVEQAPVRQNSSNLHLVEARAAERKPLLGATVEAMRERPRFAHRTDSQLLQACATLTERLQQCDLTINFNAAGFFKAKNNSASYQQMYERTGLIYTGAILGGAPTSKAAYNRNTKQVFAALNFGKNPHGPAIRYGLSYFVLNEKFKANASFYAGSTFARVRTRVR